MVSGRAKTTMMAGSEQLLGVFPGYLSHSIWVFWDAIREFDPAKRKLHNPHPLGAPIRQIANVRPPCIGQPSAWVGALSPTDKG